MTALDSITHWGAKAAVIEIEVLWQRIGSPPVA
jgi:hypothetical protein